VLELQKKEQDILKIKRLKYKQVEEELRQLVKTLPPGAKLPAERDLAIDYQCNFLTIRKALKPLVDDGLIVRRTGSGTFVTEKIRPINSNGDLPPSENRVGVLVYQKSNAYAFAVLQAIAHVAMEQKIDLRSCWVRDFSDSSLRQAEMLVKEGCTALTLPWFPFEMTDQVRAFIHRCPLPVSLPMLIPGLEKNCFEAAHLFGSTLLSGTEGLCRYFAKLGHQRIAFLGPDNPGDTVFQQKLGAYSCHMSRENLPTLCGLVSPNANSIDQLADRWKEYRGDLAIISYDDEHALRLMTAMHKIGLSAPKDYVILGYNNADASHYSDPPLSTVQQPFDHIGHWMLKSSLALAKGEVAQATHPAPLELIVRATCGGRGKIDSAFEKTLLDFNLRISVDNLKPNNISNGTITPELQSISA
jgi:DNA-binding LacI/PurR family transcriptional regulator